MAGTTISNVSSPDARTGAESASTLESISISPTLKRKLRTPATTWPPSTRNVPSRVIPVKIFSYGSTSRMYQRRVTRMPRSVPATISSTVALSAGQRSGGTAVSDLLHHTAFHQGEAPSRHAFAIERRACLQGVMRIVMDVDVAAE